MKVWGQRYDIRSEQAENICEVRDCGFTESGEWVECDSTDRYERGSVQRERIYILQPGTETVEGGVLGQNTITILPKTTI